jgi:sporulation protein YlmC with PRC-barrel domain
MKILDELKGKDVIDDSRDKIGEVKDVEWNPQNQQSGISHLKGRRSFS